MRVQISNVMEYRYESAVTFSPQTVRLFPRSDQAIVTHRYATTINLEADVQYRRDLFDNLVAFCIIQEGGSELAITVELEVEVRPKNPFHFLLANHAINFPFAYSDAERAVLSPFLQVRPEEDAPTDEIWSPGSKRGTVEVLLDAVRVFHREIAYEVRPEGLARLPVEVLETRVGACRDIALLSGVALRKAGVATRLVSGFFCEFEVDVSERHTDRGLHAWLEVYLPGAGWIGLDPTNGVFCDHRFIPTAVGPEMREIASIEGRYYAKEPVPCVFDARLDMRLATEADFVALAGKVEAVLGAAGVELTMGGEPTFVPREADAPEWRYAAVGPTKLAYAYRFAELVKRGIWPGALILYTPGKRYPGELDPRWALHVIPLQPPLPAFETPADPDRLRTFLDALPAALKVEPRWLPAREAGGAEAVAFVLPIDHGGTRWTSEAWGISELILLDAQGPAGLRLPLDQLSPGNTRRAFVVEPRSEGWSVFLPPLLAAPFMEIVRTVATLAGGAIRWEGYVPPDLPPDLPTLAFTADPGVLEVNLPACDAWPPYRDWLVRLEGLADQLGLTTTRPGSVPTGTGGGNHLLFGGPTLERNPFFRRPWWIASILRYWQHHPALAYLFTGQYAGTCSQAPRPDESGKALLDLELAYRQLENLGEVDAQNSIHETLRHLQCDLGGNTHRSEISFDKFWNLPLGGRGLIEFRALESLPKAEWAAAVALLWRTLLAHLLTQPFRQTLEEWGPRLHDQCLLPAFLWQDLARVLSELAQAGIGLAPEVFRDIWAWRFPVLFAADGLTVRRSLDAWPLLAETPIEGGTTSRFVDGSMERWEVVATKTWAERHALHVNGRELTFRKWEGPDMLTAFRFRCRQLYPALHPALPGQLPLTITARSREDARTLQVWRYDGTTVQEMEPSAEPFAAGAPAETAFPGAYTHDLRIERSLFG